MIPIRESRVTLARKLILYCLAVALFYLILNLGFSIYWLTRAHNLSADEFNQKILGVYLLASLAGIALAYGLGKWMAKRIFFPLKHLTLYAEKLSAGHTGEKLVLDSSDEIGELSQGLNKISDYVQNLQSQFSNKFLTMHEDLQRALEELSRQEQELIKSAKLSSMGKLAASVAHEINNPLTGIRTLAKILLDKLQEHDKPEVDLEDFRKYLFLIETEATRCGTIVKNLLSFARQDRMKMEPLDLNQILERCLSLMEYNFKVQKINLRKELSNSLPLISGDFSQIQQSLMAILINASEAMIRGGQLTVRTGADNSFAWVEIADTGSGIPPENLPYIFEPFFTTKGKGKGLGLGLSIAYGIIQSHQGEIGVQSEMGKGTTFNIRFPVSSKGVKN